jgi:hypothetical protein
MTKRDDSVKQWIPYDILDTINEFMGCENEGCYHTWLAFGGKQLQDALTLADYGQSQSSRSFFFGGSYC